MKGVISTPQVELNQLPEINSVVDQLQFEKQYLLTKIKEKMYKVKQIQFIISIKKLAEEHVNCKAINFLSLYYN